jgi:hypothetical protein
VGISIAFDDATDGSCHRGKLVLGEINCRHEPRYNRADFAQQGDGSDAFIALRRPSAALVVHKGSARIGWYRTKNGRRAPCWLTETVRMIPVAPRLDGSSSSGFYVGLRLSSETLQPEVPPAHPKPI